MTDTTTDDDTASGETCRGETTSAWQVVAQLVTDHPGYTAAELANLSGADRYTLARRLPDARRAERVTNGPVRPCSVTGRTVQTWFPASHPPVQAA